MKFTFDFFPNQIRGFDKPRVYYVPENLTFQSAHLLELEKIALFTRALQTRLPLLLLALAIKKIFAKQINNVNKTASGNV